MIIHPKNVYYLNFAQINTLSRDPLLLLGKNVFITNDMMNDNKFLGYEKNSCNLQTYSNRKTNNFREN